MSLCTATQPLVYVILLNYNGWLDTLECIASLRMMHYSNFRVVVVDNNSKVRPEELVKEVRDNADVFIQSDSNNGFAAGNNIGIAYALQHEADYVLLLNNDTLVPPNFLSVMVKRAQSYGEKLGVLGCRIKRYGTEEIWYNGATFNWIMSKASHLDEGQAIAKAPYRPSPDFISGCCMLVPCHIFGIVGHLDESYFMYYEDCEFSFRVKASGYILDYVAEVVVDHKVGASGGGAGLNVANVYYHGRSRLHFIRHVYPVYGKIAAIPLAYYYLSRLLRLMFFVVARKWDLVHALFRSIKDLPNVEGW